MKVQKDWNILPLKENSKYPPLYKGWQEKKYPQNKLREHKGNFAVATGMNSGGLVVFDWDFRRGYNRKKEGVKFIYEEYKKVLPNLANTLIAETPHGYHFYYIFKDDKVRNTSQKNISYDKKKFISHNSTKFGRYLAGLDTRANGGYVVCPPSKIDDKKYRFINKVEPIEINKEEYEAIFNFFELSKEEKAQNTVRQGFIDILEGKINPNDIASKEYPEHVYWKEVFHECYAVGLYPTDLLEGLEKFQKGFDLEKTKTQLNNKKNTDYILNGKRLSKEKYNHYFNLHIKTSEIPLIEDIAKIETKIEFEPPNTDIIIPYGPKDKIYIYKDSIYYLYYYRNSPRFEKILGCSFEIFSKCKHKKEILYSYILNNDKFYTDTINDILRRAESYLRKGLKGRDCLKEVIDYYDKLLGYNKPKEFLGFDNGWAIPQTEEENNTSIIVITDYQQEAYDNAKKILGEYSDEVKEEIKKKIREFIMISQVEPVNLLILIGWTIASPFRLFFIREYDLFPILYNYGPPNTGRSSLEDFWIIDFYRIYKTHLPPNTSIPRLEDHLSKSTFPYSLQDIKETNINRDLISMLQDYSTSIGLFERKKGSKEIEFIKYKIAGLNLDSNEILEMFTSPAINERQVFCHYKQRTVLDLEWVRLRKELKKYKLFSFLYEYTKDWTNKDIDERYSPILDNYNKEFETNSSRLLKSAAIIKFGINLFMDIFDLGKIKLKDNNIIETIIEGSTTMTSHIVDQFREFCQLSINFDESYQFIKEFANGENHESYHKGDNPTYIHHKLRFDADNKYYAYTSINHEDYKKRFNERCGMKSLVEKIQKGLSSIEAKLIEYSMARPFKTEHNLKCKPMGIIKIYPEFLEESKEKELNAKELKDYLEVIKDYGRVPDEDEDL